MSFGVATIRSPTIDGSGPRGVPAVVVDDWVVALDALVGTGDGRAVPSRCWSYCRTTITGGHASAPPTWSRAKGTVGAKGQTWPSCAAPRPSHHLLRGCELSNHIEEMTGEAPNEAYTIPYHFLAPAAALGGHRCEVQRPSGCTQLDWEVEPAVVIGDPRECYGGRRP